MEQLDAGKHILSKSIDGGKRKPKIQYDKYSFIGKEMVEYPDWVKPNFKKVYWFALLVSQLVVKYYLLLFAIWVGVVILQIFGLETLLVPYAILSFLGIIGFLTYKAYEGAIESNRANKVALSPSAPEPYHLPTLQDVKGLLTHKKGTSKEAQD